jgi:hypothetical protein
VVALPVGIGRTRRDPAEAGGDPTRLAVRPPRHPTARTSRHVLPGSRCLNDQAVSPRHGPMESGDQQCSPRSPPISDSHAPMTFRNGAW